MEKPYYYLSLIILAVLFAVFIVSTILQTITASLAIIIFLVIPLLFILRRHTEKIEVMAMYFTLIIFILTATIIFKAGGF